MRRGWHSPGRLGQVTIGVGMAVRPKAFFVRVVDQAGPSEKLEHDVSEHIGAPFYMRIFG